MLSKKPGYVVNVNVEKEGDKHVLILDGSSEHGVHIGSKSGISICLRHLVKFERVVESDFVLEKTYFTSYVRNMF